ncbi:MAG: immune inhibitor A domain-containing protein [Tetrasphaera sp.]
MKRRHVGLVSGVAVAALAVTLAPTTAQAGSSPAPTNENAGTRKGGDSLPNPLGDAQTKLREDAVAKLLNGKASLQGSGSSRVIKIPGSTRPEARGTAAARTRWVWYPTERTESIFSVLTDFGTRTMPATGGAPGPIHNQIPTPDRNWNGDATDDNSTYWVRDFNRAHFMNLMFGSGESFKDFYQKQSQGRFLAKGDVSNWVKVPYNEARYGSNDISEADGYWNYIKDTAASWYAAERAAGKSNAQIRSYLAQFDKWDRYDYDGDGNFNEPDGYIDHFQAIHAGMGEEAGGGAEGTDAIWSHRWYAFSTNIGQTGPSFNKLGGVPLGDSGMWIGDYTTEPENGGLGVFTHEFGHDLGLRDYYDTADATGMGNSSAFWTLMSAGSWLNRGGNAIGTTPGYMGPHEKLQLGWLDYRLIRHGQTDPNVLLGPADKDGQGMVQAVAVLLPDKAHTVEYNEPYQGNYEWWTGSGDDLQNTLTRDVDLRGASTASINAQVWAEIEEDYDYLYAEVSTNGGSTWSQVGDPVTGVDPQWRQLSWNLNAYAGKNVKFRFRYATDGGLAEAGGFLDMIQVVKNGSTAWTDDVESGDNGWTADGFTRMTGTTTEMKQHYYLAELRSYYGYDATLRTGPYNFGWANTKPDWVERFPFQNGMVVWYVDTSYNDNNTYAHPGGGFALPVDARPGPIKVGTGQLTNRRTSFDASFGLERTDKVTFHLNGVPATVPSRAAMPTFSDTFPNQYWTSANPQNSVKVPGSGTKITVKYMHSRGWPMRLSVSFTR